VQRVPEPLVRGIDGTPFLETQPGLPVDQFQDVTRSFFSFSAGEEGRADWRTWDVSHQTSLAPPSTLSAMVPC
jgi:hypothetical protein